jgi:Lipid A core - O-antigen ligase and related enzymes
MRKLRAAVVTRGVEGSWQPATEVRRLPATRVDPATTLAASRDPLRILLVLLTIVTVSRAHEHYPLLAKLRPALLLVLLAGGYAYLNPRHLTRDNVLKFWPMRLVVALGVIACGSAVFGISLGHSASFISGSYSKTLLYAFLLAVSVRGARDLYAYVWAYVISCGILTYFSLFVFGISRANNSYVARLNNMYTYDSNDVGVVLLVGVALTLLLLVVARGLPRLFLLLNLLLISATVARSGSRGGFIGFVAVGLASVLIANAVSPTKRTLMVIVAAIALAIGAPPGYWQQMQTLTNPTEDYNYSALNGRRALVKRGIGYMKEYPVFGLGINNFARAECTISSKVAEAESGPLRCTPPHNSLIQAGAEMGTVGLIAWGSLIIGGIVGMLRLRRWLPADWRRGTSTQRFLYHGSGFFALAMIGFAIPALFVSFAWMDPLYILAAFMTGLYVSIRAEMRNCVAPVPIAPAFRGFQGRSVQ